MVSQPVKTVCLHQFTDRVNIWTVVSHTPLRTMTEAELGTYNALMLEAVYQTSLV